MNAPGRVHPVPRRAASIGMLLFLASLAMLFFSSMLGYVIMRVRHPELEYGSIQLPRTLFVSTMLMLASSLTIHLAMNAVRRERQELFRTYLAATIVFAGLFVVVQTPAMIKLYHEHQRLAQEWRAQRDAQPAAPPRPTPDTGDERIATPRMVPFYALVVFLILIHALHVVGGMIALGLVAYNALRNRYDHENYSGVRSTVLYWHFLDAVWIIMFTVIAGFG